MVALSINMIFYKAKKKLYLDMRSSIKQKLHDLIEKIDNESFLTQVYELLYSKTSSKDGQLWMKLTPEQQKEVLLSLEESNDPINLISDEEVKRRHKKWL